MEVLLPSSHNAEVCIICIDFDRRAMTAKEARRALGEMVERVGRDHAADVVKKLDAAEAAAPPVARRP